MYYFLVVGAWGDVIYNIGNIQSIISRKPHMGGNFGVLYYGYDDGIENFLRLQPIFSDVIYIKAKDMQEYYFLAESLNRDCCAFYYASIFQDRLPKNFPTSSIIRTSYSDLYSDENEINIPKGLIIPDSIKLNTYVDVDNYFILNPVSTNSVSEHYHWPFWYDFMEFLGSLDKYNFILIGKENIKYKPSNNIHNYVGKFDSMLEIYKLCEKSLGIISTSNNLSMWSIVSGKKAFIINTKIIDNDRYFFMKWINRHPNTILRYNYTLSMVTEELLTWI